MEGLIANLEELTIYISILLMTIYGIILWYHWFKFGSSKKKSTTAIIIYIVGSVVLISALTVIFNLR